MSCKIQALFTLQKHLVSPLLCEFHVFFSFLCCNVFLCFVFLRSVSCDQCCPCLWIVHSAVLFQFSLTHEELSIFSSKENSKTVSIKALMNKNFHTCNNCRRFISNLYRLRNNIFPSTQG